MSNKTRGVGLFIAENIVGVLRAIPTTLDNKLKPRRSSRASRVVR